MGINREKSGSLFLEEGAMMRFYEYREALAQRRRARQAWRSYARNGWQSPWVRHNKWLNSVLHR